jgi:Ni/Co efflux regulator RcnB
VGQQQRPGQQQQQAGRGGGGQDWDGRGGRGGQDWDGRGGRDGQQYAGRGGPRPPGYRPDRGNRDRGRYRYDPRNYPTVIRINVRYDWRGGYYSAPYGFYDYPWSYGEYLPWAWYEPRYYINDWWWYGLPNPPFGMEWVRLGRDAVLVDTFTGRVYSVARNIFWW